jgi:hypothetical protein
MVFIATFNNVSYIVAVSFISGAGKPKDHWTVGSNWQTLSHNVKHLALIEIRPHNLDPSNVFDDMFWSGIYIKDK